MFKKVYYDLKTFKRILFFYYYFEFIHFYYAHSNLNLANII